MIRILLSFLLLSSNVLAENLTTVYQYSYIPKASVPVIHKFLQRSWHKCSKGVKYDYPEKAGVCASCPEDTSYMVDEIKKKALCFKCPEGTLLVKRDGYPMCLSNNPVISGKARKTNGEDVNINDLQRMASRLSGVYKTYLEQKKSENRETFRNKEKLKNVCPNSYPDDKTAKKQIEICRRLRQQNDFLCPYVEKNETGLWTCRACPKNAPYKNDQGGCFNCPYGEEMVPLEDGTLVCASEKKENE